jgi:hypothetical protein
VDATIALLRSEREIVMEAAASALDRSAAQHYGAAGSDERRRRLEALFDRVVDAMETRNLASVVAYGEQIAEERYHTGYDIAEVQTAFNVLEEAVWVRVLAEMQPTDLARALGLTSTVFGAAKDALARRYVALATQTHVPSLDLRELFAGTERAQ